MTNPLLSVSGLTKRFGGLTAVNDLSFDINEGEIIGVIGPNGAGKSTVFNCVMGTYQVTAGTIRFNESNITSWDTHKIVNYGLARVTQDSTPIPDMTARENIRLFTLPNSVTEFRGGASDDEIDGLAERLNIVDVLDEVPGSLSHEETRRLEIARALATEPDLLLLDEPFAGLTQAEVRELSDQIRNLRDDGITIVIVDHNMKGLMTLVDHALVIHSGEKLAVGTPDDIADNEEVHQVYLGSGGDDL